MLSRIDETDLAVPLHDGVHESPLWATFLARLRRRARADGAALVIRPATIGTPHDAEMIEFLSGDIDTAAIIDMIRAQPIRPSRVYGDDDIGVAMNPLRIVRIDEPEGRCTAWLFVSRAHTEFGAAESAVLAGLVPHVQITLRNWATLEHSRGHAVAADAALSRLGGGWLAVDADGRIVDIDRGAADALRAIFGKAQPIGERLPVAGRKATTLAAAITAFAADRTAPPQLVALSEQPPLDLLAMPAPRETAAVLLGCIRTPNAHDRRAQIVARLFGLSPSEARLADALAQGATLADAAIALGLTIETARNYSKLIYAKTGARGQADVVRLILNSVAAFA